MCEDFAGECKGERKEQGEGAAGRRGSHSAEVRVGTERKNRACFIERAEGGASTMVSVVRKGWI